MDKLRARADSLLSHLPADLFSARDAAQSAAESSGKSLQQLKQYVQSKDFHQHASDFSEQAACHAKAATDRIIVLSQHPHFKEGVYALILVLFGAWFLGNRILQARRAKAGVARPSTPQLEKAGFNKLMGNDRKPGEWKPSPFVTPIPPAYPDWSLENTKPLPYRPFRYGPKYNVTMGLRTMPWNSWIELDNHYPRYHADKARRIAERGSKCCRTHPDAFDGACELLEELRMYLPARYPILFERTPSGIKNLWSGEDFDIFARPLPEDPMQIAARLVQDDLAIMFERPDGQYYLLAGAVLLAGFWRLEDKYMMPLSEIHTSGDVPQFREKLEKGMLNFFRRIKPEDPVLRNNYFLQVDDNLAWSNSIGSEDSEHISWNTAAKNRAIEHHYFRSERQSLRRLPRSGGVVFTIRTYFHPITEIAEEDHVPARLASAVRSWGEDVSKYKGREKYGEVLLEYLDGKEREQRERGVVADGEESSYPW